MIVHLSKPAWKVIDACSTQAYVFGTATGKRFQQFGGESAPSTNFVESLVGDFMTSDARLFREWHDWAFRRMSRTRFSIIKRARFREWPPFIRGTTFSLSVRKR